MSLIGQNTAYKKNGVCRIAELWYRNTTHLAYKHKHKHRSAIMECTVKNGLNITIRELEREDLFRPDYVEVMNHLSRTEVPTEERADLFMKWVGLTAKKIWLAIDMESRNIVGSITVLHDVKSSRGVVMSFHIEEMVTHPQYERLGIATALINQVTSYAHAFPEKEGLEVYKIVLTCADGVHEEKNNIPFYERSGFVHEEAGMALRF